MDGELPSDIEGIDALIAGLAPDLQVKETGVWSRFIVSHDGDASLELRRGRWSWWRNEAVLGATLPRESIQTVGELADSLARLLMLNVPDPEQHLRARAKAWQDEQAIARFDAERFAEMAAEKEAQAQWEAENPDDAADDAEILGSDGRVPVEPGWYLVRVEDVGEVAEWGTRVCGASVGESPRELLREWASLSRKDLELLQTLPAAGATMWGVRRRAVARLRWSKVDVDRGRAVVEDKGLTRIVELGPIGWPLVAAQPRVGEWVWPSRQGSVVGHVGPDRLSAHARRIFDAHDELRGLTLHQAGRHAAACAALAAGAHVADVAGFLGHVDTRTTTERYLGPTDGTRARAVLEQQLDELPSWGGVG